MAGDAITEIAEKLGAPVIGSINGKGIIDDSHPLSLSGGIVRGEVQRHLKQADVVLAIGTELSEVDSEVEDLDLNGKLIRVDLDPRKMNDLYPAEVAIMGDAKVSSEAIARGLGEHGQDQLLCPRFGENPVTVTSRYAAAAQHGDEQTCLIEAVSGLAPERAPRTAQRALVGLVA